jgi:hypothetical protein
MLQSRINNILEETDSTKTAAILALGKLEDVSALARLVVIIITIIIIIIII